MEQADPAQAAIPAVPDHEPAILPMQAFALTPGRINPAKALDYMHPAAVKHLTRQQPSCSPTLT